MIYLAIAMGGAAGACARYAVGMIVAGGATTTFPWATLAVNVSGAWTLGVLMRWLPFTIVTPPLRAGLTIGFCGGFTTFSTFAFEGVTLMRQGQVNAAVAYIGASALLGVGALAAGLGMGALLSRRRLGPA